MSWPRIFAIFSKDTQWALKNLKLLALMLAPVLITFVMGKTAGKVMLTYSVVFSVSFIGLFLTSYITTEEKRIGAFKNILVSPLTPTEMVLGKFLFPLSICLFFGVLNFAINQQLSLLLKPDVLLAMILLCGTICFIGTLFGLFFKNEQELGIVAPILFFGFITGNIMKKTGNHKLHAYFPDYHFTSIVDNHVYLSTSQKLGHLAFQLAMFLLFLLISRQYIRYYFSSDSDSPRINLKTLLLLPLVGILFAASGQCVGFFDIASKNSTLDPHLQLNSNHWSNQIAFPQNDYSANSLMTDTHNKIIELRKNSGEPKKIMISINRMEDKNLILMDRLKKLEADGTQIIAWPSPSAEAPLFVRYSTANERAYSTVFNRMCKNESLTIQFEHPLEPADFKPAYTAVIALIKDSKWDCHE